VIKMGKGVREMQQAPEGPLLSREEFLDALRISLGLEQLANDAVPREDGEEAPEEPKLPQLRLRQI
jgi:hypothetical protein